MIYKDRRRSASFNPSVEAFLCTVNFVRSNLFFCHTFPQGDTLTQRYTHTLHGTPLITQLAFNCSNLTIEIPKNYMKFVNGVLVS